MRTGKLTWLRGRCVRGPRLVTTSEQHPLEELDRIAEKAYVETIMRLHAHIVMDVNGDTRHTFNPESEVEAREAMNRFE